MAQPSRFLPLRDVLQCQDDSCFIGAITNIQAPVQPNKAGGDHIIYFTIRDKFPGDDKDSVACIIKRRKLEHLPKGSPGDVAILRGMKVEILGTPPKKTLVNCSELQSEALFFPAKTIPGPEFSQDYHVGSTKRLPCTELFGSKPAGRTDQMAVISMKAAAAPLLAELQDPGALFQAMLGPNNVNPKRGKRLKPLKEWEFGNFYDLSGEVVKTFWGTHISADLYVTDYTTNTHLFLYEEKTDYDPFEGSRKPWPGPFGQMTIQIRTYGPHAEKARELKEGDFVHIQNVRAKWSEMNVLEGAIHQDPQYPGKINVRKCTNKAQLDVLMERKAEYEKSRTASLIANDEPINVPKKPSAIASHQKKQSKIEKKRLERERMQKELEEKAKAAETVVKGLNKNSECLHWLIDTILIEPSLRRGQRCWLLNSGRYREQPVAEDHNTGDGWRTAIAIRELQIPNAPASSRPLPSSTQGFHHNHKCSSR
jgi:protection-of-telomeres protein 1